MGDPESELIDTAIVIKNIPFTYPEDDFLNKLFPQLGLIPPYAFNYHRNKNDKSFHGLAFANFNSSMDAQTAVDVLNNYELDRRKLRVELKKRLPAEEEQRQKLARQTRRQFVQQTSPPFGTGGGSSGPPPGLQQSGQQQQQFSGQELGGLHGGLESMSMANDILDPSLRPFVVFHASTTPTQETGM